MSNLDLIESIIKGPSIVPSEEAIKALFGSIPSSDASKRAQALQALEALASQHEGGHVPTWIKNALESRLHSTQALEVCNGLDVLSAIYSISQDQALQLVHPKGFFSRLANSVVELAALNQSPLEDADLNKLFSEFLALYLVHKPLGERIRSEWPECLDWLTGISLATSPTSASIPARCGASLALMKFGKSTDQPSTGSPSSEQLVDIMMTAFLGNKNPPHSAIEGLALLSEEESAREILRKRSEEFFQTTQSLSQSNWVQENLTSAQAIASGLATIILNLVAFKVIPDELPIDESRKKRMQASTYYTPWHLSGDGITNERADRKLLDWLKPALERNSDLIQTVAWVSKTDGGNSLQLKKIATQILLNLVEYDNCAQLVFKSGGCEMVMDIINSLEFSKHLSHEQAKQADSPSNEPLLSDLELHPHELEAIEVLAKLIDNGITYRSSPGKDLARSMIKPLAVPFLHASATELQDFLALKALSYISGSADGTAEIIKCSQILDRLDELIESEPSKQAIDFMDSLLCNPAYRKRFAPATTEDSTQTDTAYKTRLENLITLIEEEDGDVHSAAANTLYSLTDSSPEVCKLILSDPSLTETLLKTFRQWAGGERDVAGFYSSTSGSMMGVFKNIYKQLDCSPEDDPPALFVDDRLHYALWLIDDYCEEGMEHGDFKDCRDLQDDVTELSTWIVDNFESRKKFKHHNLNGRESADYDDYR
ncbi:hypothetical protein PGT21_012823 [Puccinia graminis f. sp. tritici]|uniref:UNC-45/Cro1/She4 central domain-containing protein n=1 Tax=Puccinia graminis f. sp. tritici TaxID=56615 RepID=A0A5B0M119_PUCGR|nr:hypothetical protein PGT21_012823 [Puccinia graminis f. sp. tritici]KAA1089937.1 hypothetical protein PGTUg99_030631 [Puccinia graminis f. sp. tritici]